MKKIKAIQNQKGITLVEVLAVLVILGVLATVAIPAIGGIIDNSKRDAMVATAKQMVESARMMEASGDTPAPVSGSTTIEVTLENLINGGYIEVSKGANGEYNKTSSKVVITPASGQNPKKYEVTLTDGTWTISQKEVSAITRSDVQ